VRLCCAAFFLCDTGWLLAVPLLAAVAAMLVVWLLNSMTMLLRSPVRPIGVQKQERSNLIFSLSAPASWLFATGGDGKVRSRPRVLQRVHRSAAESLDGFFPSLSGCCLKRGHLAKKEIRFSSLLLCARKGRALRGRNGPAEVGSGRRTAAEAREETSSPEENETI